MHDTSAEAQGLQTAALRRLDGPARLTIAAELSEAVRSMALTGLRTRYPHLDQRALVAECLRRTLAPDEVPPVLR